MARSIQFQNSMRAKELGRNAKQRDEEEQRRKQERDERVAAEAARLAAMTPEEKAAVQAKKQAFWSNLGKERRKNTMAYKSPDQVIEAYKTHRKQAVQRLEQLAKDPRLTVMAKKEEQRRLSDEINGLRSQAIKDYNNALEETRRGLHTDLIGSLKRLPDAERRSLLEKAEGFSQDKGAFKQAVERAQNSGDDGLLDALVWAARADGSLRRLLPVDRLDDYAELDEFEQSRKDPLMLSMELSGLPHVDMTKGGS